MGDAVNWLTEHWAQVAPMIVTISAFLMMVLPQGKPGSFWDIIRKILNFPAFNKGSAQNRDTNAGG